MKKKCDVYMPAPKKENEYRFNGECVEVTYYNSKREAIGTFLVDEITVEKIRNIKWSIMSNGYIAGYPNGKAVLLHRFIMDCPDGLVVDHINHDRMDNRLCNLRICTQRENNANVVPKPGRSGVVGISLTKSGYYIAQRKGKYLGCSRNIEIAKSYL